MRKRGKGRGRKGEREENEGRKEDKRKHSSYYESMYYYNTDPSSDCDLKGVGVVGVAPLWWMGVAPLWVCLDLLAGVVGVVWEAALF